MISNQQIAIEWAKCYQDTTRIYMIENYMSTFDATQNTTVQFKLFPKQKEMVTALSKYPRNILTKPRQSGISTTSAAFVACEMSLSTTNKPETVLIVANRLDLSKLDLRKIKEFLLQLPRWFWGSEYYGTEEKEKKTIFVKDNDKYIELFNGSSATAISSGKSAARGVSACSTIIFDEMAFIDDGETVYSQAVATTASGGKIILISTPNGKSLTNIYYSIYEKARKKENDFNLVEMKWHQDPRYNKNLKWSKYLKEDGSQDLIIEPTIDNLGNIKYDNDRWDGLIQQGYKAYSPWYDKMCNTFNHDKQKIAQELDVSFEGSAGTVVDQEVIEFQEKTNTREPIYYDNFFKDAWIFKEAIFGHRYLLTADTATGSGEDSSVVQVIDIDAVDENNVGFFEQVFEYKGKIQGDILAEIINQYGRYYGEALAVVDCVGSSGDATVLKLQSMNYPNIYFDDPNLKNITNENSRYIENSDKKALGFRAGYLRNQMLMNLEKMLRFNEIKIRSKRFISELNTWIWKNGKPDHQSGAHDDTITAMAMGLYILQFSFKKLESVKEKNKAILNSMVLVQNILSNKAYNNPESTRVNKIPMPFYTGASVKQENLNKAQSTNQWAAMDSMANSFFGR